MTAEKSPLDSYLFKYLFETYPLDKELDADMFELCVDDFISYLAYEIRSPNADYFFLEYLSRNTISVKFLDDDEYKPTQEQIKCFENKYCNIIVKFVDEWWSKFHERSRVIFKNQIFTDEDGDVIEDIINDDTDFIDLDDELEDDEINDILDYIEGSLIKHGEIAFVSRVATELLNGCMEQYIAVGTRVVNDLETQEGKMGLMGKINEEIIGLCRDKKRIIATFVYDYCKPIGKDDNI